MDMEMSSSLSLDLILLIESVVVNDSLFSSVLAYYVAQQTNLAHNSSTIFFLSQVMCMTKDFSKSAEEDRKLIFSQ